MKIPQKTLDEILRKVDIMEYISKDTSLSRKGDRFWGCCPIHKEKTPSFSVVPEKGFFYCFGCNAGGNLFKYIMETDHVSFPEAVEMAAEKAGVTIEKQSGDGKEIRLKKEALLELYGKVTGSFSYILENSPGAESARRYLKDRGITQETANYFQLGYAPADARWLWDFLIKKNYSSDFLDMSGLFSRRRKGYPLFRDRLVFPIFDLSGRPVAFSARLLQGDGPKYINSPETDIYHKGNLLFGLGKTIKEVKDKKQFVLCEGNMDLLALYQTGIKHVAAPLGTAFTNDQLRVLKRYCAKGTLLFDSDKAGRKASMKAAILCEKQDVRLSAVNMPEGMDPADILLKNGEETLKKMVESPVNIFDFLLKFTADGINIQEPEGKEQLMSEMMPFLESISSEIIRKEYLNKIAEYLIIDKKTVMTEYRGKATLQNSPGPSKTKTVIELSDELFLVLLCVLNPDVMPILKKEDLSNWSDPLAKGMGQRLKDGLDLSREESWRELSDHPAWPEFWENRKDDPLLKMNALSQAEDLRKKIMRRVLFARREQVSLMLQRNLVNENERALLELMKEKKRLDDEIENLKV